MTRNDTRQELILAAERIIAEQASTGVSLRQIIDAAGVRNMSAIQYHFGSREGLVEAIFEYRMRPINDRRKTMLANLRRSGNGVSQRDLVSTWVLPLAEDLLSSENETFYFRFLMRVLQQNDATAPLKPPPSLLSAWGEVSSAIADTLAYLPRPIIQIRLEMARTQILASLAAIEQQLFEKRPDNQGCSYEVEVEALIDAVHAILIGPVSPDVMEAIRTTSIRLN